MSRHTEMNATLWLVCVSLLWIAPIAGAERFPMTWSELQESHVIVQGTVEQIRIETERALMKRPLGSKDWGIYLTLQVEEVIKGRLSESEVEVRCFRIKHRRGFLQYISHNGHAPIPAVGTRVRAHLNKGAQGWHVAYPNGFVSPEASDDESLRTAARLRRAPEVARLKSRRYTYGLPVEYGAGIGVVMLALAVPIFFVTRVMKKRRRADASGSA